MTTLSPADRRAVLKVLKKARVLIRKGWTQGPFAVNKDGRPVPEINKNACAWCAAGAVRAAVGPEWWRAQWSLYVAAKRATSIHQADDLVMFNEAPKRTKAEVLDRFSRAITRLEAHA